MLCELGRIDEARERLAAEAAHRLRLPVRHHCGSPRWRTSLDAAATTGDRDAAHASSSTGLRRYAEHVISPVGALVVGAIARPLARAATLLGDYDQAEEWFAIAHDIHDRLQAPFWTALGQLDHADLCLARRADGDLERARELVTTAAATAAEYGCAGLTRRADALLADLTTRMSGVRAPQRPPRNR